MCDNRIMLRLFTAVPNEAEAERVASLARAMLADHGRICRADRVQRYWKIPEYFEIFLVLQPGAASQAAFNSIMDALATGWDVHRFETGGDWAVWNPSASAIFHLPKVRWANVECFRESAPPHEQCADE